MSNLSILQLRTTERTRRNVERIRYAALAASIFCADAFAQVGGGTGTGDLVQSRTTGVITAGQAILYSIGGIAMSAAALYTTYGIAWQGKKWSDLGNVAGAMAAGGMAVMLSTWLFT